MVICHTYGMPYTERSSRKMNPMYKYTEYYLRRISLGILIYQMPEIWYYVFTTHRWLVFSSIYPTGRHYTTSFQLLVVGTCSTSFRG